MMLRRLLTSTRSPLSTVAGRPRQGGSGTPLQQSTIGAPGVGASQPQLHCNLGAPLQTGDDFVKFTIGVYLTPAQVVDKVSQLIIIATAGIW